MPGMIYAQDKADAIHVNLYVSSEAGFAVGGGRLRLAVTSEMPWQGRTRIALGADRPVMAAIRLRIPGWARDRSEEHTSELQSLMRISYAVFCLKKKRIPTHIQNPRHSNK